MEFEDRITIATPEGVDLELALAGVGSRFVSGIVDFLIQSALVLALAFVFLLADALGGIGAAIFTVASFVLFAGYDIVFEVFGGGRTPGKRLNGLRVLQDDGRPIGFFTSAVRNVLRLVDFLPSGYLLGIAAVLVTRRNQRLGDLAAGTLVVRDRRMHAALPPLPQAVAAGAESRAWDVGAVTRDEVIAVRTFLERRGDLDSHVRSRLARELARPLRAKVPGVADHVSSERFLEELAASKAQRE